MPRPSKKDVAKHSAQVRAKSRAMRASKRARPVEAPPAEIQIEDVDLNDDAAVVEFVNQDLPKQVSEKVAAPKRSTKKAS